MGWFEIIFIYVVSWWMLLFMLLPIKAGAAESPSQEEYHSAPKQTYLRQKIIGTSLLSAITTAGLVYLIEHGIIALWLPYRF